MSFQLSVPIDSGPDAGGDAHFLRALVRAGDTCPLRTSRAIHNHAGIKLVDAGAPVNSRLLDRLLAHRLEHPIEHCVTAQAAVDGMQLVRRTRGLAKDHLFLSPFASKDRLDQALDLIASIPLPQPLALTLTVVEQQRPEMLDHALALALIALHIGMRLRMSAHVLGTVAAAALLHDLGELHLDPASFTNGHRMTPSERRQLSAHPAVGMLMAQRYAVFPAAVGAAILEHHERLDGSGYPRGLRGTQISPLGRLIMVAEVAAAFTSAPPEQAARKLSLLLKLNHRKFARPLTEVIIHATAPLLEGDMGADVPACDMDAAVHLVHAVAQWRFHTVADQEPQSPALAYWFERMTALEQALKEAGLDLVHLNLLAASLPSDQQCAREFATLVSEAGWQLADVRNEIQRRWPELVERPSGRGESALSRWLTDLDTAAQVHV